MKTSMIVVISLAAILSATCRADYLIDAVPVSDSDRPSYVGADSMSLLHRLSSKLVQTDTENRTSRQTPALLPELISRIPVSRLFDVGAKALNVARFWPAGLASLVVGTAPTTGAVVGVVAISIFIIVIWLVIYSIGVLPVGAALAGRNDVVGSPYDYSDMMPYQQNFNAPYPYHRYQRSLADASRTVMNAIDQFQLKNN